MLRSKLMVVVTLVAVIAIAFAAVVPAKAAPKAANSIVDVAISVNSSGPFAGSFDTLIAALLAADPSVINTLSGKGQFTVFAPTDDAFAKLGLTPANIGSLDKAALTNILLYHVAHGSRYANSVVSASRIRMLNKGFTFVMVNEMGAFLDGKSSDPSKIIVTDVPASNGVIHVIDNVLLP